MITPELANLHTLVDQRLRDPLASAALATLRSGNRAEVKMRTLLRDHRTRPISDPDEIRLREGMDRLLGLYALIEVGCYAQAFPAQVPDELQADARPVVLHPDVSAYYEQYYPLELVKRFKERIERRTTRRVSDAGRELSRTLFPSYLEADRRLQEDEAMQTFLKLLDDFHWIDLEPGKSERKVGFGALMDLCRSPETFARGLVGDPAIVERLSMGCRGLVDYLGFASQFDGLLRNAAKADGLAECFWLHYEYWFRQIGTKFGSELHMLFDSFEEWPEVSRDHTVELREVVNRLLRGPSAYIAVGQTLVAP